MLVNTTTTTTTNTTTTTITTTTNNNNLLNVFINMHLLVYGMSLLNMFAPSLYIWKPTSLPTARGRRILLRRKQTFAF